MNTQMTVKVVGHVKIVDDLGHVHLDQENAIHPENMARVISRALSNEHNFFVNKMAFGNGGTVIDAANTVTFKTPNNGITDGFSWRSTLYNQTYSEIVNENLTVGGVEVSNPDLGDGPGANPSGDPTSTPHNIDGPGVVSRPIGTSSQIRIQVTLNAGEPTGQFLTDTAVNGSDTETAFMFDEIGLFTSGKPLVSTTGYQDVDVLEKQLTDDTGLAVNTLYEFSISVDGAPASTITFDTGAGTGGIVTYNDIIPTIQGLLTGVAYVELGALDVTNTYQVHSKLRFRSLSSGAGSTVVLTDGDGVANPAFFANLTDFTTIEPAVDGEDAGLQNDAVTPENEAERLLTHIIFNPVLKSSNRTLTINYTITVSLI